MGKLVIHNHFKNQEKEKREQEILQIVVNLIKKRVS